MHPACNRRWWRKSAFLQEMEREDELRMVPSWKAHQLVGSRKGTWSLSVTRNWRLTFRVDNNWIVDLNYEDYHSPPS